MSDILQRIRDGRTDLVVDVVDAGQAPDTRDAGGVSLIQWCAYYGDVSGVRFLLRHGESLESLGSNFDLNGAVFHGHWRLAEYLIEQGADVTRAHPDTMETPLHAAVCRPQTQFDHLVRILLHRGADPNAATVPSVETGSFMRDARTRGETPLHRAAAFASAESIQRLIDGGAAREARDVNGDSPLSWASWHNRSAHVLEKLRFGPHTIHPVAVERSLRQDLAGERAMDVNLQGTPHLPSESPEG